MRNPSNYGNNASSDNEGENPKITLDDFIGNSKAIMAVKRKARMFAADKKCRPILITGDRGTGKEVLALAIYNDKAFKTHKKNFLTLDCGALNRETIVSQLFGHVKGSFTGADRDHKGCIAGNDGGTVFMDEVGNLNPDCQQVLHRALSSGRCMPVGGMKEVAFNVQLIFATNRNLPQMCQDKEFMPDLFDRIRYRVIHIPSLCSRKEDIPLLLEHYLKKYTREFEMPQPVSIHPVAMKRLMAWDYPGNVRELEYILENAFLLLQDEKKSIIRSKHLIFDYDMAGELDTESGIRSSEMMRIITAYVQQLLDQNRALWENVPVDEIPCLFNMVAYKKFLKEIVYRAVGCNKSKAAKLMNLSPHQFDDIDRKKRKKS
jgi:DNA-binding NtrC family response regulator